MKTKYFFLAAFFFHFGLLNSHAQGKIEYKHFGDNNRKVAPDFKLKDIHGKIFHFSDYKGKVILMYFWETSSPYAAGQIKQLIEIQKEYAKDGLQCIAVAFDSAGAKAVKPVSEELGIFFPSLVSKRDLLKKYEMNNRTGFTFIIDKQQKVFSLFSDIEQKRKSDIERWVMILMNEN